MPDEPKDLAHRGLDAAAARLAKAPWQTLLNAADTLCGYASGGARLLLSGLLVDQRAEVEPAYAGHGVYVRASKRDGWVALEATGWNPVTAGSAPIPRWHNRSFHRCIR